MDVEDVQQLAATFDVSAKASTAFATVASQVVILGTDNRRTTEDRISVRSTAMRSRLAEANAISSELIGDELRLVLLWIAGRVGDNLLKSYNIGVTFAQHIGNACGIDAAVHASALMNIVSSDT